MTITLKPIHLALLGFFAGGILVALLGVLLSGNGDGPATEFAGGDPEETETASPTTEPAAAGGATEPPLVATEPPPLTATAVPPTLEPVATSVPPTRTATPRPAPQGPAPATSTPVVQGPSAAEIEAERSYRVQASAQLLSYITRFNQFWNTPSQGYTNDVLEYGGIAGAWANQMAGFEPAPPRFRRAHNQMRAALYTFDNQAQQIRSANTQPQLDAWFAAWDLTYDGLILAYADYKLVTGISFPGLVR